VKWLNTIIDRINAWWQARQRRIDIETLWPSCRDQASDLEHARKAFMLHIVGDPAWSAINDKERKRIVSELK
jgi:hypothetical protein